MADVSRKTPYLTLLLSLLALLLFLVPGAGPLFQWERALMLSEPWRWFLGHLTHWNPNHLVWDLIMFAAVGAFCEWRDRRSFVMCLAAAMISISAGVGIFLPQISYYRGLSGLDSALFVLMALHLASLAKPGIRRLACLALVGFVAKLVFETVMGHNVFVQNQAVFVPVPIAHLIGAFCGLFAFAAGQSDVATRHYALNSSSCVVEGK